MPHLLYEGDSCLDGKPIVILAAGIDKPSQNIKTGPMMQTFILRSDISPIDAVKSGEDYSICGDCKHRNLFGKRTCYVNYAQSPQSVWNAYKRGNAIPVNDLSELGRDRIIRLGSYGDPAAAPTHIWQQLTSNAKAHTGYTHHWDGSDEELKDLCMASVDTPLEAMHAQSIGWRTFRVKSSEHDKMKGEAICPASEEAGHKIQCIDCKACSGTQTNLKGNIVINVHGVKFKTTAFERQAA